MGVFAQIDNAVGLALLGLDPKTVLAKTPDPSGIERGFQSVGFDAQVNKAGPTKVGIRKISFNGIITEIPIWRFSARGQRVAEQWPSMSYELIGCIFNPQRYIWKADRFADPVNISFVDVDLGFGKTVTGPSLRRMRDNPEPFDLMYDIRVWSKNNIESFFLEQLILETFPARGALKAIQADGTPKLWEMRLNTINNVDDDEPTLANQQQRGYSWVHTYVIESFIDNTLATRLQQTLVNPVEIETVNHAV